jgi:hypothetical protein
MQHTNLIMGKVLREGGNAEKYGISHILVLLIYIRHLTCGL